MPYKAKIERAIELAENLEQLAFIEDKLKTTDQINRRTKAGRELEKELLLLTDEKAKKLINKGAVPF